MSSSTSSARLGGAPKVPPCRALRPAICASPRGARPTPPGTAPIRRSGAPGRGARSREYPPRRNRCRYVDDPGRERRSHPVDSRSVREPGSDAVELSRIGRVCGVAAGKAPSPTMSGLPSSTAISVTSFAKGRSDSRARARQGRRPRNRRGPCRPAGEAPARRFGRARRHGCALGTARPLVDELVACRSDERLDSNWSSSEPRGRCRVAGVDPAFERDDEDRVWPDLDVSASVAHGTRLTNRRSSRLHIASVEPPSTRSPRR